MRFSRILCLGAALALAQPAFAELPFPVQTLAEIDGALDYCAEMKPESADVYKEFGKQLVKDVPEKDLEAARSTKEYKEARKSATEEIRKLSKQEAAKSCSDFLKANK
jgi:hypothetical protein